MEQRNVRAAAHPTLATASSVPFHFHPLQAQQIDVIVIGGGISGTLAAAVCARNGYGTVLIDRSDVYPEDFRAEHLDGSIVDQVRRMGFLGDLTDGLPRGETVVVARNGRLVGDAPSVNYGLRYEDLVNRARRALPASVHRLTGKVAEVVTTDRIQTVRMTDGTEVQGRLIVLATGQSQALALQAGIGRQILRQSHSLTFGFDIEPSEGRSFPHSFIVYQRESVQSRIDYLAAFTLGMTTRVNLFTYRSYREPWTRAFLEDPAAGLRSVLPRLTRVTGDFRAVGSVKVRPIDLYVARDFRKDGIVLIGDVFQASCPATGMGLVRLLTDIERLTTEHLPRWLETDGMAAVKISSFYDDPVKRACDAKALHDSEYRRALSTDQSLFWTLHRHRVALQERTLAWLRRNPGPTIPRVAPPGTAGSLAPG